MGLDPKPIPIIPILPPKMDLHPTLPLALPNPLKTAPKPLQEQPLNNNKVLSNKEPKTKRSILWPDRPLLPEMLRCREPRGMDGFCLGVSEECYVGVVEEIVWGFLGEEAEGDEGF